MDNLRDKQVYVTDINNNLTYYGFVKAYNEDKSQIDIKMADVKVYEYSSSNYLQDLASVDISVTEQSLFIEV